MKLFFDIETIPEQGDALEKVIALEKENFKAPSGLTKGAACKDLGLEGNDAKFITAGDALIKWAEKFGAEKAPALAEDKWRKTSFDAAKGEIISLAWAVEDGEIESAARGLTESVSEGDIIQNFYDAIAAQERKDGESRKPFLIGHYISGFDLRFIFQRSIILGVKPSFNIKPNGRHGVDYFDTMIEWAGYKGSISQDNLCKALDIEGKPGDINGALVWDFVRDGNHKAVEDYNRDDVNKVRQIYNRLTFKGV